MELNEKLLSLRKKNKLTQAQVSETLDVSRQAISNWETGPCSRPQTIYLLWTWTVSGSGLTIC